MPRSNGVVLSFLITVAPLIASAPAWADTPVLYSSPAYESPVRGDPDDLLLISGSGLSAAHTVVYQALGDTTQTALHPTSIPASSTATLGVADLVSSADAPYSLTVHLPAVMSPGRAYGLWVVTPDNQWSTELRINDARPLWITPDSGYQTASLAGLPRVLKVVGRNLQSDPNATGATQVRLLGQHTGTTYILTANNTSNDPTHTTAALERYVAAVNLPSPMVADQYSVQVSRDDTSWVALLEDGRSPPQTFWVKPDPTTPPTFDVSAFAGGVAGPCLPNDGVDDTACILLAIRAAQAAGGGTVTFGPGTWLISKIGPWYGQFSDLLGLYAPGLCAGYFDTCAVTYFGLFVPLNVNLQGAGASGANSTIIERGAYTGQPTDWPATWPVFTFQGNTVVSGFRFIDDNDYLNDYANQGLNGDFELQLGATWFFAQLYGTSLPLTVSNIVITNNVFDKPFVAIGNGGLPADHIYITYNTFGGAFSTGIEIAEDENNVGNLGANPRFAYQGFHWNDTVVSHNTFYPSSFQAAPTGDPRGNGTVATQLNTGLREDFSDNVADGTSTQYFYSPTDPKGWRAAFFWSTGANQEMTLVSNNSISCPGDKYGDGEAIAYDGDGALGGMPSAQPVVAAAPWIDPQGVAGTTLSVQGAVATQLPSSSGTVDISANPTLYYQSGFWLQVVQGKGKGQWRKVESLSLGTNSAGSTVTLNVTPAFDVVPDTGSKVVLGRAYWQNATVNNAIDQRTPLCTKANSRDRGGTVLWYGSTADSVMDGNQLYDTTGIYLNHTYQPQQPGATPVKPGNFVLQAYNEVHNNLVTGAYDWSVNGRTAGIELGLGATGWFCDGNTCPAPPPPTTGFGVSIAKNVVSRASARDADGSVNPPMGGISSSANWETGVLDGLGLSMWQLGDATLIFNNTLQDVSNTVSGSAGGLPLVGIGIDVAQGSTLTPAITWRSTLYNNTCNNVDKPTSDFGLATVRYCPTGHAASCECSGVAAVDVGLTATSTSGSVSAGGSVTYTITLTNNDVSTTASDVNLSLEPSPGVQISGTSFVASQGTCDVSVNICLLGSLAAGQSATVTVTGTLPNTGNWPVTFSVTHAEADSVPRNDSATVTESVL